MKKILATCAAVLCLAQQAPASSIEPYTGFVGFGDSLSDAGRFAATGLPILPPSNGGRFTDGRTWMEQIGNAFQTQGYNAYNLALGGATAGANSAGRLADYAATETLVTRDPSDPNDIPFTNLADLSGQISSFFNAGFAADVGSNPLVTILLGGNDFLQAGGTDPATVASNVITALSTGIAGLAQSSPQFDSFMIANLPDFSIQPSLFGADPAILGAIRQQTIDFNTALAAQMTSLAGSLSGLGLDVEIEIFDLFAVTDTAYSAAIADGLIVDEACTDQLVTGVPSFNNCVLPGSSSQYLFMDDIHPGEYAHNAWADAALAQIGTRLAPIPLPASLPLLAVGGLALIALRRRAA